MKVGLIDEIASLQEVEFSKILMLLVKSSLELLFGAYGKKGIEDHNFTMCYSEGNIWQ